MKFNLTEFADRLEEIDFNTFMKFVPSQKLGQNATAYANLAFNKNYADSTIEPVMTTMGDTIIDEKQMLSYCSVSKNEWTSNDKTTTYYSMDTRLGDNPYYANALEEFEKCRINSIFSWKKDVDDKDILTPTEEVFLNILNGRNASAKIDPMIRSNYLDKKTNTVKALKDKKISFNINFDFWQFESRKGVQISRFSTRKTEEEMAASKTNSKVKKLFVDQTLNSPDKVLGRSGKFYGELVIPGKLYTNKGQIKMTPYIGLVCVIPGASSYKKSALEEEYENEELENVSTNYSQGSQGNYYSQGMGINNQSQIRADDAAFNPGISNALDEGLREALQGAERRSSRRMTNRTNFD